MDENSYVRIMKLNDLNTLVIRQTAGGSFFITSKDGIIISVPNLAYLIKYLIFNGLISTKVLEGILLEYHELHE